MSDNRDFKGVWIPKEIWELNIPISDKFYLAIYQEQNDIKIADEIMLTNISKSSLLKIKNRLSQRGLITYISTPEQAKQFVIDMVNEGQTCEWCHRKNYVLHEHHYPVSKSHGGTKVVKICPNCHATYHYIFKED